MRRAAGLLLLLLAAACAPAPQRTFMVGAKVPLRPRDEAAARRLGLAVEDRAPAGVPEDSAADASGQMASWERLRFLGARAAAQGRPGVFYVLPDPPPGRTLLEYPEEWQALARAVRELRAMKPIVEAGTEVPPAFSGPGLESRTWRFSGRRYSVLVNVSSVPVRADAAVLGAARALFEVRAAPGENLTPCAAGGMCLDPGRVLWLESRLE